MKKRLTYIRPLNLAVGLGAIYLVLSIVYILLFLVVGLSIGDAIKSSEIPTAMFFGLGAYVFPIVMGLIGFLFGAISAFVYNLVARFTGGTVVILEDAP